MEITFFPDTFDVLLLQDVVALTNEGDHTVLPKGTTVRLRQRGWGLEVEVRPVQWTGEPPLPNGAPL